MSSAVETSSNICSFRSRCESIHPAPRARASRCQCYALGRHCGRERHHDLSGRSWSRRREGEGRSKPMAPMAACLIARLTSYLSVLNIWKRWRLIRPMYLDLAGLPITSESLQRPSGIMVMHIDRTATPTAELPVTARPHHQLDIHQA